MRRFPLEPEPRSGDNSRHHQVATRAQVPARPGVRGSPARFRPLCRSQRRGPPPRSASRGRVDVVAISAISASSYSRTGSGSGSDSCRSTPYLGELSVSHRACPCRGLRPRLAVSLHPCGVQQSGHAGGVHGVVLTGTPGPVTRSLSRAPHERASVLLSEWPVTGIYVKPRPRRAGRRRTAAASRRPYGAAPRRSRPGSPPGSR